MKINVRVENDGTEEVSVNVKFDKNLDSINAMIALIAINKAVLDCFPSAKDFLLKFFEEKVANDSAEVVN